MCERQEERNEKIDGGGVRDDLLTSKGLLREAGRSQKQELRLVTFILREKETK